MAIGLDRSGGLAGSIESPPFPQLPTRGPAAWPEDYHPSADDVRREIDVVLDKRLSPALEDWSGRYARVGARNIYLWKWCRRGVEVTTLSCVDPGWRETLWDTKVLGIMLDVLLDDVADRSGDDELLEQLLSLPFDGASDDFSRFPPEQAAYAQLTVEVWREIWARARRFPRFDEFAGLLRYDYLQLLNVMRYSHLLNGDLDLLNLEEHDIYLPHNMHMMISSTLDLMCSPRFDRADLGRVREAAWHGQCMGRIGNLVTTWERELGEGDFTSGVYARAVALGDVTIEELRSGDRERIRRAIREGGHEDFFLDRWQEHRRRLLAAAPRARSVDLSELVAGLQRLICLHLGSRGSK